MTLKTFPIYDDVVIMTDLDFTPDPAAKKRSVWLGWSQSLLNLPRHMMMGALRSAQLGLSLLAILCLVLFREVFQHPFMCLVMVVDAGHEGRLMDKVTLVGLHAKGGRNDLDAKELTCFDSSYYASVTVQAKTSLEEAKTDTQQEEVKDED